MNLAPDVGFSEIIVIAIVALVALGPKELPRLMHMAGKMTAQARRLAGEFQAAFNQMAREAEMEELRKEIDALKRDNAFADAKRTVDDSLRPLDDALRTESQEVRDTLRRPVNADAAVASSASSSTGPAADPPADAAASTSAR